MSTKRLSWDCQHPKPDQFSQAAVTHHVTVATAHITFPVKPTVLLLALACSNGIASTIIAEALPIDPGSWTLVVLPDTQNYVWLFPKHFQAQAQWIVDHADSHKIKYVLHEGDITSNNTVTEWSRAVDAMKLLNGKVPYAMVLGNHDYEPPGGNTASRATLFNESFCFGPDTYYAEQVSIEGFFEITRSDNCYHMFSTGGDNWLILAMELGPRDEVVAWANEIVESHPDHLVMLVTHAYMYHDETRYDWATKRKLQSNNPHMYPLAKNPGETINDGQELWDKLVSKHKNFRFVFSGHVEGDGTGMLSSVGEHGNVVHQMLANYQNKAEGGQGDMRLLEFKSDHQTVMVRTYSPVLDRYDSAYDQQCILNMNEIHPPLTRASSLSPKTSELGQMTP